MNVKLTPKQELFAIHVSGGMNQSAAYRLAYDAENMLDETIHSRASEVASNSKVAARIEELRKPVLEAAGITLKAHLERLQEIGDMAAEAGQYSAAITAEANRGKVSGLYIEKVEAKVDGSVVLKISAVDERI